jgi:uncharacterized protein (DUF111 family)
MTVSAVGYGAGTGDLRGQPNVLSVFIGEAEEASEGIRSDEEVSVIEANLDDMNPQIYGYFVERALSAGALDAFTAPVQMKKGRPGTLLTQLCKPADTDRMMDLLFEETTTIGARIYTARRRTLARESVSVQTSLGAVRMKLSRMNGHVLNVAPEYEDCQRIAVEKNVPLKRVLREAMLEFDRQRGKTC